MDKLKIPTQLFINNQFVDSEEKHTLDVFNPATEELICKVQKAGEIDTLKAISGAREAFNNGPWVNMSRHQRQNIILKFASLLEQNAEEIALIESLDMGKPKHLVLGDIQLAIQTYKYYAGFTNKMHGKTIPIEGSYNCYTTKEPVGVCAQIIPWNFPFLNIAWKFAPCLAAGCVTILKSSEKAPLTALKIASYIKEAGFPPGVIQILTGEPLVGQILVQHKDIDKISFTGSTLVGKYIMSNSATTNLKRISLELGGKSPNIICHDADLDLAVEQAVASAYSAPQGQSCSAGTRTFVHASIYDEFCKKIVPIAQKIVTGDPLSNQTNHGPLVDKIQFDKVLNFLQIGKNEGATLLLGGDRLPGKGYFIQPTIFSNVTDNMTIAKEEIFGPVMSVLKFENYEEVIKRANDTQYGLVAGIMTQSIDLYNTLAKKLRAGTIYVNTYDIIDVNTPYGGYKGSGLGRELGKAGLEAYLETKTHIVAFTSKF